MGQAQEFSSTSSTWGSICSRRIATQLGGAQRSFDREDLLLQQGDKRDFVG